MIDASDLNNNVHDKLIRDTQKKIINSVFHEIKHANNINNANNIIYELPYYFEHLIDILETENVDICDLRTIVWGNILEILRDKGYQVTIDVQPEDEKCYLLIRWTTSIEKHIKQIDKYSNLINNYRAAD